MEALVITGIGLALDGLRQMAENNKLAKADLAVLLAKADALKVATDAIVDDFDAALEE